MLFEAKTRRRRGDTDESETCRKAFRVSVKVTADYTFTVTVVFPPRPNIGQ